MTTVVSIQALIFQDGGLLALGANLFNMGIVGVAVSYFVYTTVGRLASGRPWGIFAGGFAAAWSSIFIAALACALELALSGTSPANVAVPAMGSIHALIGVGEGLITVGALTFLFATRPDLLAPKTSKTSPSPVVWAFGLGIALVLAVLSPLASAHPDGLEWVAGQRGFLEAARAPLYSMIPGYIFPGITNKALATIVAGIVGTLIVLAVALGMAHLPGSSP
jgi:cobalt/nickel transport system permease protein